MGFDDSKQDVEWTSKMTVNYSEFCCGNENDFTITIVNKHQETELPTAWWMNWNILFSVIRLLVILFENSKEKMPLASPGEQTKEKFFFWKRGGLLRRIVASRRL